MRWIACAACRGCLASLELCFAHTDSMHVLCCAVCCSLSASTGPRFRRLNASVASLLDEYSLVSFVPLDISDEDSIGDVLLQVKCRCTIHLTPAHQVSPPGCAAPLARSEPQSW